MWSPPQRLVQDSLLASARDTPGKASVIDEAVSRSYAEVLGEAQGLAHALQEEGLARGDRVAVFLDNTAECAAAIFGVLLAGGAFIVVNPQTKAEKLAYMLADSEATFLLTEAHSAHVAYEAVSDAASVKRVFSTPGDSLPAGFLDLRQAIAAAGTEVREIATIPSDLAALIYTSGTTGEPKGVMMSHQSLVFTIGSIAEYLRLDSDDRILSVLPLAFTYGLSQLLLAMRLGGTLLLERSFAFPAKTMARIRAEEATVFPAVPTVFTTLLGTSPRPVFPSVRRLTNAAAGLAPTLHEGLAEIFPNALLFRMYGLTECMRVCYLEPELLETKPTSVGRAIPGTETFVLDDDGRPVEPGETGVLHSRGPHVMLGYWKAPDLTAHMLVDGPLPGERTLRTNDRFTIDEDGLLYFVGRSDDIIKTRGEKVSAIEVENALHAMPGIRQAAVVGVPDELLGQAVRAFVVLDDGVALSAQEIIRYSRARLENFMVPKEVVLLAELPHTDSGKVRKRSLVETELD
jgi:amino acid adenylation domain-containing protein